MKNSAEMRATSTYTVCVCQETERRYFMFGKKTHTVRFRTNNILVNGENSFPRRGGGGDDGFGPSSERGTGRGFACTCCTGELHRQPYFVPKLEILSNPVSSYTNNTSGLFSPVECEKWDRETAPPRRFLPRNTALEQSLI